MGTDDDDDEEEEEEEEEGASEAHFAALPAIEVATSASALHEKA
jgi:hypothetical protein